MLMYEVHSIDNISIYQNRASKRRVKPSDNYDCWECYERIQNASRQCPKCSGRIFYWVTFL